MEELFELSQELARAGTTDAQSPSNISSAPRPSQAQSPVDPVQYIPTAHQLSARLVAIRARYQQKNGGK